MRNKRISFGNFDIQRIYEWYLAMCQADPIGHGEHNGACPACSHTAERVKKFLGKDAKEIERLCKKYPYVEDATN